MIAASSTLFRYISRQFLASFIVLMTSLLGILLLFDVIEMLRRAAAQPDVPLGLILSMSLMKLPTLGQSILPMVILFTAIHTCWKLNKTSELVVIRSFGLSVWQFLSPMLLCALLIGIFSTAVVNPVSSIFLSKHNRLDNLHFQGARDPVAVSKTGIWLRQPSEQGYALIHSESFDKKQWQLNNVTILFFDDANAFLSRMDSPVAYLREGYWEIRQPLVSDRNGSRRFDIQKLQTELTAQKIEESFADPETISFWNIPEYIRIMEETGFPATRLYVHFHTLLAQPFFFIAMVLLAATFSLHPPRFGGGASMIVLGIAAGFFIFFMESMLQAFGISQKIPAHLAAWSPSIIGLLLGVTALLHLEDG
ncbi:MAG: LPS export ABC transporter permease LptG [Pseudomonadota bacterium]